MPKKTKILKHYSAARVPHQVALQSLLPDTTYLIQLEESSPRAALATAQFRAIEVNKGVCNSFDGRLAP
jgi:hypothetical protein